MMAHLAWKRAAVGICAAIALGAGESAAGAAWPLADQVRSLASLSAIKADYRARSGPLRATLRLRVDGERFRYESIPLPAPAGPHYGSAGGHVYEHRIAPMTPR